MDIDIKKMSTRHLLAEYRHVRSYMQGNYDMYDEEIMDDLEEQYKKLKAELNTREHIPNSIESKKIRQEKGKKSQRRNKNK